MSVHHLVLLLLIMLLWPIKVSPSSKLPCKQSCGSVVIWYPYGIDEGCYHDKWFKVICNSSSSGSSQAFLDSINLEIRGDIFYSSYTAAVRFPANLQGLSLQGSPFSISTTHNRVIAFGCDKYATMNKNVSNTIGCLSTCTCAPTDQNLGCCYFVCPIASETKFNSTDLSTTATAHQCKSAFLVDNQYLESISQNELLTLKDEQYLPLRLQWGPRKGRCAELFASGAKSCNKDNYCLIALNSGYYCRCDDIASDSYQGCVGDFVCNTTNGQHCSEDCPPGYETHYFEDKGKWCSSKRTLSELVKDNRGEKYVVLIGCSAGLGMLMFLFIGAWWSYKFIRRRKEMTMKKKFFRRNGGLLLEQRLSSNEDSIAKSKLFTSKELKRATDNYNVNRILGQGGQGTVYKGMLEEGRIVAIKKSKIVDESKVEEFINEVVILSQINHKNVIQLLGCCLETEVPLLVYEFISNGTLYQHLHDKNEEFPITWELRLRIATEVAGALCYLHSAASTPIYHRDIKSTNILLDDKYRAKVSDFGTSRSLMVDQTHLTTQVQGTFGYIDPQYFQSNQFTEKSDVYSFGVVLAELLTGQKPICAINNEEDSKSLATYFLEAIEENRLFEILDARVLKEGGQLEIMAVSILTGRCLNFNGKKRPTMREVATELDGIRASHMALITQQSDEGNDCVEDEIAACSSLMMTSFCIENGSSFTRLFPDGFTFSG